MHEPNRTEVTYQSVPTTFLFVVTLWLCPRKSTTTLCSSTTQTRYQFDRSSILPRFLSYRLTALASFLACCDRLTLKFWYPEGVFQKYVAIPIPAQQPMRWSLGNHSTFFFCDSELNAALLWVCDSMFFPPMADCLNNGNYFSSIKTFLTRARATFAQIALEIR